MLIQSGCGIILSALYCAYSVACTRREHNRHMLAELVHIRQTLIDYAVDIYFAVVVGAADAA